MNFFPRLDIASGYCNAFAFKHAFLKTQVLCIRLLGVINVARIISAVDVQSRAWIQIAKGAQSLLFFVRQCNELAFIVATVDAPIESPDHGPLRDELFGEETETVHLTSAHCRPNQQHQLLPHGNPGAPPRIRGLKLNWCILLVGNQRCAGNVPAFVAARDVTTAACDALAF
jgi:hypothetical protein